MMGKGGDPERHTRKRGALWGRADLMATGGIEGVEVAAERVFSKLQKIGTLSEKKGKEGLFQKKRSKIIQCIQFHVATEGLLN